MTSYKPSFIQYLLCQNKHSYRTAGQLGVEGKAQVSLIENNYETKKAIIDFLLLLLGFTIIIFVFYFLSRFVDSSYEKWFNPNIYDPNAGWKFTFLNLILMSSVVLLIFAVIPLILKLFRAVFGLRWFFVKFTLEGGDIERQNEYLKFYNWCFSLRVDSLFYKRSKRSKQTIEEKNPEFIGIAGKKIFSVVRGLYHVLILALLYSSLFFIIEKTFLSHALIILYSILVFFYACSHVFTYCYLRRNK